MQQNTINITGSLASLMWLSNQRIGNLKYSKYWTENLVHHDWKNNKEPYMLLVATLNEQKWNMIMT